MVAALAVPGLAIYASIEPRNDRDWSPDLAQLPVATFDGANVLVRNVRNARYETTDEYTVAYEGRQYDLNRLESVWYVVEPFAKMRGPAHTFVSFGFGNGEYVAISAEIRRERGEHFSALGGLLKRYELTYVVADERDVILLRTNYRHDQVYLYPVRTTLWQRQRLFRAMLERANALRGHPEFYNTLTNTCTTNIVHHVNAIAPHKVPFSFKVMFPGYSDELAYDLGLIDTELPFAAARERYHINARAARYATDPAFSDRIRQPL